MAEFTYRAASPSGHAQNGRLSADNRDTALRQLRSQGLMPICLTLADPKPAGPTSACPKPACAPPTALTLAAGREHTPTAPTAADHIPATAHGAPPAARTLWHRRRARTLNRADVLHFTTELSVMLRSGLALDRALKVMASMSAQPSLHALIESLLTALKDGKSFSQALRPHQSLFGAFYINVLRAGEASGHLGETLEQLAGHLDKQREVREHLLSALTYPAILLVVAVLSILLMLGFVVPQFETLFKDMGEALPWPTHMLISSADLLTEWGLGLFAAIAGALWLAQRALGTPGGRRWCDTQMLRLPILGRILRDAELSRFARSLGTLLANGVAIVNALQIAADTLSNQHLREALAAVPGALKRGERLAHAIAPLGLFSPLALNMVHLGEETARLDAMLIDLAKVQERAIQTATKRALTLIEPVLILLLGGGVATIMAAILMGILSVNEQVI